MHAVLSLFATVSDNQSGNVPTLRSRGIILRTVPLSLLILQVEESNLHGVIMGGNRGKHTVSGHSGPTLLTADELVQLNGKFYEHIQAKITVPACGFCL